MSTDVFRRYIDIVTESAAHAVTEMDKSQPSHGRDGHVSHSTYGSRDKEGSDYFKGKELPAKPITVKKMEKDALDILKKQGMAEDQLDEIDIDTLNQLASHAVNTMGQSGANFAAGATGGLVGGAIAGGTKKAVDWYYKQKQKKAEAERKKSQQQGVAEGLDPIMKKRLNALIDLYRKANDPNEYSNDAAVYTDDVIAQIRAEFGDRIAYQVKAGKQGVPEGLAGSLLGGAIGAGITKSVKGAMAGAQLGNTVSNMISKPTDQDELALDEALNRMREMAGIREAAKKPDDDKDGIPNWADKDPKKAGGDEDRKVEESILDMTRLWKAYRG